MRIEIKRIYDEPSPKDGTRVLVDRLWPRGISKDAAELDHWAKELTPSPELRQKFHCDRSKFAAFTRQYKQDLKANADTARAFLDTVDKRKRLTLLTATKDLSQTHATVLKAYLESLF